MGSAARAITGVSAKLSAAQCKTVVRIIITPVSRAAMEPWFVKVKGVGRAIWSKSEHRRGIIGGSMEWPTAARAERAAITPKADERGGPLPDRPFQNRRSEKLT